MSFLIKSRHRVGGLRWTSHLGVSFGTGGPRSRPARPRPGWQRPPRTAPAIHAMEAALRYPALGCAFPIWLCPGPEAARRDRGGSSGTGAGECDARRYGESAFPRTWRSATFHLGVSFGTAAAPITSRKASTRL